MSLNDENNNAEGGNGFLSSTPSALGEETKDGGNGKAESKGNGAESFSFTVKNGPRSRSRPCKMFSTVCLKKGNGPQTGYCQIADYAL